MPSIKEAVHTAIDQDIYLQEGLARDILNKSAAARWLIKRRGIEGSFETVCDAVEAYEPDRSHSQRAPWTATEELRIHQTKYVDALVVERTQGSFRSLARLFDDGSLAYQETYRIIPSRGRILIIIDSSKRDRVVEALGAEVLTKQVPDLFQIAIQPRDGPQPGATALSSLVLALANRGVEVSYVATGATEHFLLVPKEQEGEAMDVLTSLLIDPTQ